MLSAQRKEFDEKKEDESPYPVDFARWYALDYFRRPSSLKSRRFWITLTAALFACVASVLTMIPAMHSTHQTAPVSRAHAKLNNQCANCHDAMCQPLARLFSASVVTSVSDPTCKSCHESNVHHAKQAREPACATCHREHQEHENLSTHIADRHCVQCHGNLPGNLTAGATTTYHNAITRFSHDHPEFAPSAPGKKDQAKIRFNHKAHLDLDLEALKNANARAGRDDLQGFRAKMECADCHQMDEERKYPKPINYENHCARCHALNAILIGDFSKDLQDSVKNFTRTPLPHRAPEVVRAVLRDRLIEFAQANNVVAGKALTMPRPLPWRPVTEDQLAWAKEQAKKTEDVLFLNRQWQRAEPMSACNQCHIEAARKDGSPSFLPTAIPARWQPHSVFNHNAHRTMECVKCHDNNAHGIKVADSQNTEDILLPTLKSCQECHTGGRQGARDSCVECHRYHQR